MNPKPVSWWKTLLSVLAGFFGVQSSENYERDNAQGNFGRFMVMGVIATLLFIVTVYGLVQWALHDAGL